jgi:hypothetical protein
VTPDRVTFKDLYEVVDKVESRIRRLEIGLAVVLVAIAAPKAAGTTPDQAIAAVFKLLA